MLSFRDEISPSSNALEKSEMNKFFWNHATVIWHAKIIITLEKIRKLIKLSTSKVFNDKRMWWTHLLGEGRFLIWSAELEELLDDVVAEDIGHQWVRRGENFLKNELLFAGRGPLKFLLDEAGPVLVLAELDYVVRQVAELETRETVVSEVLEQPGSAVVAFLSGSDSSGRTTTTSSSGLRHDVRENGAAGSEDAVGRQGGHAGGTELGRLSAWSGGDSAVASDQTSERAANGGRWRQRQAQGTRWRGHGAWVRREFCE